VLGTKLFEETTQVKRKRYGLRRDHRCVSTVPAYGGW
jgi:hypothetical protein